MRKASITHSGFVVNRSVVSVVCLLTIVICQTILFATDSIAVGQDFTEFQLHPDCRMELVAREPQVVDPIAARFDEKGRLWVVEMRDYPTLSKATPSSRIRLLQDLNQDGFFETATTFADRLLFPTGIQPWKNGVIVTLEGKIVYLADNDGDLVCDEEQIWYEGFSSQNTQLRANHPTLAPDGRIYVANGLRNGTITGRGLDKPLSISGMDFSFDPIHFQPQSVTGYGQFGLTFDEFGNRYTCTNRNPLKRVVFENRYVAISKEVRLTPLLQDVAKAGPDSRLYPISSAWTTSNLHANQFTAACGVQIHHGNGLPLSFRGNAFVCDPTGNLVHREVIHFQSAPITGMAKPGRKKVEFLASTSDFFRPVNLSNGPDGALYVVDMRRQVIEHPDFMPKELKNRPDLRNGSDLGRIYRIVSKNSKNKSEVIRTNDPLDWVTNLKSENGWMRATAQRMLQQSPNQLNRAPVQAALLQLAKSDTAMPDSVSRAMWLLHRLEKDIAWNDYLAVPSTNPQVQKHKIVLAEKRKQFHLVSPPSRLDTTAAPAVFQWLLSAALTGTEVTGEYLLRVSESYPDDPWMRLGVLLNARKNRHLILVKLIDQQIKKVEKNNPPDEQPGIRLLASELAKSWSSSAAIDDQIQLIEKCLPLCDHVFFRSTAIQLLLGLRRRGMATEVHRRASENPIIQAGLKELRSNAKQHSSRLLLIALLVPDDKQIANLVDSQNPELQLAAIEAMQLFQESQKWVGLAKNYPSLPRRIQDEVLKRSLTDNQVAHQLLALVADRKIRVFEINSTVQKSWKGSRDAKIRKAAQTLLTPPVPGDRKLALKKYASAISLATDARAGKKIFEKTCANCHQLGKLGKRIGPDISDTRTKSRSQLLQDILMPNAAIDSNYLEFNVATDDGRSLAGIIVEESTTHITLRQSNNETVTLNRNEIEKIASTGKSLMPDGLEKELSLQQMANLISFLQNWRYLEQNIPFDESQNAK